MPLTIPPRTTSQTKRTTSGLVIPPRTRTASQQPVSTPILRKFDTSKANLNEAFKSANLKRGGQSLYIPPRTSSRPTNQSAPLIPPAISQRKETISAAPQKPLSPMGKFVSQILPKRVSKPLIEAGGKVKEFFNPSLSTQMKTAYEEDTARSMDQIRERAAQLDREMGIVTDPSGNRTTVAVDAIGGSVRKVTAQGLQQIAKSKSPEVITQIVKKEIPELTDKQSRILGNLLKDTTDPVRIENILKDAAFASRPTALITEEGKEIAARTLTDLNKPRQAAALIKRSTGAPKELAEKYAQKGAAAMDETTARQIIEDVITEMRRTELPLPKPRKNVDLATTKADEISSPLVAEARKYKSAEEFVSARKPIYHGTAAQFETFSNEMLGSNTGASSAKRGVFAAADPDAADEYAKGALGKRLFDSGMSDDALDGWDESSTVFTDLGNANDIKIAESFVDEGLLKKMEDGVYRFVASEKTRKQLYPTGNMKVVDLKKQTRKKGDFTGIADLAKKEGYDGVVIKNTYDPGSHRQFDALGNRLSDDIYITFNTDTLKTKSQLTDIWKKANDTVSPSSSPSGALTPFDTPEIIAARAEAGSLPKTSEINTPERQALREKVTEQVYGSGALNKGRRLDIVMGIPAAGKSTVVAQPLAKKYGSLIADSDEVKKLLPEYNGGKGAMAVHEESARLNWRMMEEIAFKNGDNLVFPTVGNSLDSLQKFIGKAKAAGYDIYVHLNDLPPEKAAQRAVTRFQETGRFVDPDYVFNKVGLNPSRNYDIIKTDERISGYAKYSNDVPKGSQLRLLETSRNEVRGESLRRSGNHDERSRSGGAGEKGRVNQKLEERVAESRTFEEFYRKTGITRDALDATVQKRGWKNAFEYYNSLKTELARAEKLKQSTRLEITPNVIKGLSEETMVGPMIDKLRELFPNISNKTLSLFAKRLAKLKRTQDIESHIKTLKSLSEDLSVNSEAIQTALKREVAQKKTKDIKSDLLESTLGESTLKLLSRSEQKQYIENLTQTIKSEKDAVMAQQEYDLLWENLGQKIFDRYEELQIRKAIVEEALDNMPAKGLSRYISKTTGRLPEVTGKDEMKSLTGSGKSVKTSEFGRRGDDIVTEYGFSSVDEAQEALDQYLKTKEDMEWIKQELRDLRPKLSAARYLKPVIDDVPVVIQKKAGEIDVLADADRIRYEYKDISGFAGGMVDPWRNFKKFFGKHYEAAKKAILDPFDDSKGDFIDELNKIGDSLDENIVSRFGFKRGSKESAAIQRYADTGLDGGERLSYDQLLQEFGAETTEKIIKADKWFRTQYDRMIDEVNEVRARIYPNNPDKLIPKREDYYRHFKEMGEGFKGLYDILFESSPGIEPKLAGLSERTKPKSKHLSFAQTRTGKGTDIDAIGGFLDYANAFSYAKHIDQHIGSFRYLRRVLADNAKRPGTKDEDGVIEGVNNFVEYLDDFANILAGKTNPVDRYIQKRIPGGRKMLQAINWLNGRIKGNAVVTASGGLSQILNLPQVLAETKTYFPGGFKQSLADLFEAPGPISQSSFIKERYALRLNERFNIDWDTHKVKRTGEEARRGGRFIMTALDQVVTRAAWNALYKKGVVEGVEDPVRYADELTRNLVAGRGIGEVPIDQQGKIFQLFAPFMIEVMNGWYVMRDFVSKKDYTALAIFFTSTYLLNEMLENVRGSRGSFDPINAIMEGLANAEDEWESGNYDRAAYKFTGRVVGEVLSNVAFGQQAASFVNDDTTQKYLGMEKKELFGQGDPGRFGNEFLIASSIKDPLWAVAFPVGGMQAKKTMEAIQAMLEGQVDTKGGKLNYEISKDPLNLIQAILFGKYSIPEAQEAFEKSDELYSRLYVQDAERTQLRLDAEKKWSDISKLGSREERIEALKQVEREDPKIAEKIKDILIEQQKGLNSADRLIKMLGVENGERAKYIASEVKGMKTREEKLAFLKDLTEKGLISVTVQEQILHFLGVEN